MILLVILALIGGGIITIVIIDRLLLSSVKTLQKTPAHPPLSPPPRHFRSAQYRSVFIGPPGNPGWVSTHT